MKTLFRLIASLSFAVVGAAYAATPGAPTTLCSDKTGSATYAMCVTIAGGANIEVGDIFQIGGWEEQKINGVWTKIPAGISIRRQSSGGSSYETLGSGNTNGDPLIITYTFQTPGQYVIYSHTSTGGDSPALNFPVVLHTPIYSLSAAPNVSTANGTIQLAYSVDLYQPSGSLELWVNTPNNLKIRISNDSVSAPNGGHVIYSNTKNFTFTSPTYPPGNYAFYLKYLGDNFNSGQYTSNQTMVQVGPFATTTALTASSDTTLTAQPVTLNATVTGTNPAHTTPTGLMSFYDGTTLIGSVAVSASGTATLTTTQIASTGSHSITANYSGDAINQPSNSAAVLHQVNFDPSVLIPIITTLLGN